MNAEVGTLWFLAIALFWLSTVPFVVRMRREERETERAASEARSYGLHEPASLHPLIDPSRCIGAGNCVDVCPEGKVIGLRQGQATVIAPASCIGHGLCERSCPMEAIKLVFGTKTRGVDLPRIDGNFETNVPGLFVIGELGGMGLIRSAFEQGRQCIEGIARAERGEADPHMLDLLIVGAGPAGLAASIHASRAGLRHLTLEREADPGGTVRHYPRKKLVMTEPVKLPGFGTIGTHEILKEELVLAWDRIVREADLPIRTGRAVDAVRRDQHGFTVQAGEERYRARRVILAIGRRGVPRKLGVTGESLGNVQYALAEPEAFRGDRTLVVGGGDSAVEAAMALSAEPGTTVRISYRRDRFSRIKPKNRTRLDAAIAGGGVEVHWSTNIRLIELDRVWIEGEDGDSYAVDNDQVFIFAGGELPTRFLRDTGVEIDTKFGTPR